MMSACQIPKSSACQWSLDWTSLLLSIAFCMNPANAGAAWKAAQVMAPPDARGSRGLHLDGVIAFQIPDDPHRSETMFTLKIENLFPTPGRCAVGMPFGDGRPLIRPMPPAGRGPGQSGTRRLRRSSVQDGIPNWRVEKSSDSPLPLLK